MPLLRHARPYARDRHEDDDEEIYFSGICYILLMRLVCPEDDGTFGRTFIIAGN